MPTAKLTALDRLIGYFDPRGAVRRAQAREVLAYYEAAKPDRTRKARREAASGNDAILRAGTSLREQARHLEQNYDLALGVLNTLITNTIGAHGIGVEPQPRNIDGSINNDLAMEILDIYKDWSKFPDVTGQHDWPSCQRMLARSGYRDGEVFIQHLIGPVPFLDHGTVAPYSIEMLESDYIPMDMNSAAPRIVQGIEINTWGRPVGYHVHKSHPSEGGLISHANTKRIPAANISHLANRHRIRQLRGVSVFASVLGRFDNLKDYEESERIAAMIAASMAAYIKKGSPDDYVKDSDATPRAMKFRPGMIFDDLNPGEEIGTIDTNRPNPNLEAYRNGQMRAIAAGTGPTYSSLARTYDGTYSSQRQELVEGYGTYGVLANEFTSHIVRPVYENVVRAAILSGRLRMPAGIVPTSITDAIYIAPQMPWIDPEREANAYKTQEDAHYISGPEIIRRRGGNPIDVLEQQRRWNQLKKDKEIT